jgi:hypothetical protein
MFKNNFLIKDILINKQENSSEIINSADKCKSIHELDLLPNEIQRKIYFFYLQKYRMYYNIIKSNLPNDEFKEYNFYNKKNTKIDWNKFKIGDKIITSPYAKWGWKERETYIRCYCPNCKDINNYRSTKLKENYFIWYNDYLCKDCNVNGLRPNENKLYKICRNCFECFKDSTYNDNIMLCLDCINPNILVLDYCDMSLKYSIYFSCSDCNTNLPKLCAKHYEKKVLYKYDQIFKDCKICKKNPQMCRIHKYWFMQSK